MGGFGEEVNLVQGSSFSVGLFGRSAFLDKSFNYYLNNNCMDDRGTQLSFLASLEERKLLSRAGVFTFP